MIVLQSKSLLYIGETDKAIKPNIVKMTFSPITTQNTFQKAYRFFVLNIDRVSNLSYLLKQIKEEQSSFIIVIVYTYCWPTPSPVPPCVLLVSSSAPIVRFLAALI